MDVDDFFIKAGVAALIGCIILFFSAIGWSCYNENIRGNKKIIDTAYTFNYADVYLPNGEKKTIEIDTWADYEGEQIQIFSKDGNRYLISSFNAILREK